MRPRFSVPPKLNESKPKKSTESVVHKFSLEIATTSTDEKIKKFRQYK
jgi:hypothetical protein